MSSILDLRELADELEQLRDQAITCDQCDDGLVDQHDENVAPVYCEKCGGDSEYVPEDKSELPEEDYARLQALEALEDQLFTDMDSYASNEPMLISESSFTEYAQELATDLGYMDREGANDWPLTHIDWDAAADALKIDYQEVTFDGDTYLIRAY